MQIRRGGHFSSSMTRAALLSLVLEYHRSAAVFLSLHKIGWHDGEGLRLCSQKATSEKRIWAQIGHQGGHSGKYWWEGQSQARKERGSVKGLYGAHPVGKPRESYRARCSSISAGGWGDWGIYPPTAIGHHWRADLRGEGTQRSLQTVEGNGKWKPNQHTVTWIKLRGYMQRGHGVPWLGAQWEGAALRVSRETVTIFFSHFLLK